MEGICDVAALRVLFHESVIDKFGKRAAYCRRSWKGMARPVVGIETDGRLLGNGGKKPARCLAQSLGNRLIDIPVYFD